MYVSQRRTVSVSILIRALCNFRRITARLSRHTETRHMLLPLSYTNVIMGLMMPLV